MTSPNLGSSPARPPVAVVIPVFVFVTALRILLGYYAWQEEHAGGRAVATETAPR